MNLLVAVAFVIMGVWVITLAGSATMTGSGTWIQTAAGDSVTQAAQAVLGWLAPVPEPVLGLALLTLAGVFVWTTLRDRRRTHARPLPDEHADADPGSLPHCHSTIATDQPIADPHHTARN